MAELIHGLDADTVRANLQRIREQVGESVEILAAVKYVPIDETEALIEAGVTLAGENRQQDLAARSERFGDRLTFDFIGHLQSRKVKTVLPRARLIHSVATDSVLAQLQTHGSTDTEVLVEVNLSGEESKSGVAPEQLDDFLARCPVRVSGLMTMPPLADDPEASRPHFERLRDLAAERDLLRLSMGTSQDYAVAVESGSTIVRVGTILYR
jgi:pyridoxal phosphate enzyme (YggS family)